MRYNSRTQSFNSIPAHTPRCYRTPVCNNPIAQRAIATATTVNTVGSNKTTNLPYLLRFRPFRVPFVYNVTDKHTSSQYHTHRAVCRDVFPAPAHYEHYDSFSPALPTISTNYNVISVYLPYIPPDALMSYCDSRRMFAKPKRTTKRRYSSTNAHDTIRKICAKCTLTP